MHEPDSWAAVGAKREQQMKSGNVDADVAGGGHACVSLLILLCDKRILIEMTPQIRIE